MSGDIVAPIRRFCAEDGCDLIAGAFVYGSVAAGSARPGSDIDCFALLTDEVTARQRHQLATGFANLQRRLGYTPDPVYPIELFTAARCRDALSSAIVQSAIRDAFGGGRLDPAVADADDLEVFRALVGIRLRVVDCDDLERLSHLAWGLVADLPPQHRWQVLQAVGVRYPMGGQTCTVHYA